MDLEQIQKRLDWLDTERRKDKTIIATLDERNSSASHPHVPVGAMLAASLVVGIT